MTNDKTKKRKIVYDKTEDSYKSSKSVFVNYTKFQITQTAVNEVCKSLDKKTDDYRPSDTIDLINKYINGIKSNMYLGRILYSDISAFIFNLSEDNMPRFLSNMERLQEYSEKPENGISHKCQDIINRIHDHASLAELQKRNIKNRFEEVVTQSTESIKTEIKEVEKEYIGILGIFASVVLAFNAGVTFTGSVLENIHQASVYRLIIAILLIAFVILNVIYFLFYCIERLVRKRDNSVNKSSTPVKQKSDSQKENVLWICLCNLWKEYLPIIVIDLVILLMVTGVGVMWWFGLVEQRNNRYDYEPAVPTIANMTEEQLEEKIEEILNETMKNNVDVDITISGELQEAQSQEIPVTGE